VLDLAVSPGGECHATEGDEVSSSAHASNQRAIWIDGNACGAQDPSGGAGSQKLGLRDVDRGKNSSQDAGACVSKFRTAARLAIFLIEYFRRSRGGKACATFWVTATTFRYWFVHCRTSFGLLQAS